VKARARELQTALAELRELARGIHAVVLTERGLEAALDELAARSPVPVAVDAELEARLPPAHEAALYFVAAEALTNVAKYARASTVRVKASAATGGRRSRSPTTASEVPKKARALACAASPIDSKHSADGSLSRARPAPARPSPPGCPAQSSDGLHDA
jgi:hypothetical protein